MSLKGSYDTLKPSVIPFANVDVHATAIVTTWMPQHAGYVTVTCTFSTTADCAAEGVECSIGIPDDANAANSVLIATVTASLAEATARSGSASFVTEVAAGVELRVLLNAAAANVDSTGLVLISYL